MNIAAVFKDAFGQSPALSNFTPGRVNLIGEHTDYNGGMVLPTALNLGLSISFTPRHDNIVRIYSDKFDVIAEASLDDKAHDHWADYARGAIVYANKAGFINGGANIAISTTLPFGAGLSSSAALTVGLLKLTRDNAQAAMTDTDISVLARRIENEFIGMPCGIMDQMAVAIAKPGQALALDTNSLSYDIIDLPADYHMTVMHSGQYRRLSEGHYKLRKEECDSVKAMLGRDDLCLMTDTEFDSLGHLDAHLIRRARHCMTEHRRTTQAVAALKSASIATFGRLMNESHMSMRDDFEISLPAIDALVNDAISFGALGARLTGGGFGGCIVACVHNDDIGAWTKKLIAKHPNAFSVV